MPSTSVVRPVSAGFGHTDQITFLPSCLLESTGKGAFESLFGRPLAFSIKACTSGLCQADDRASVNPCVGASRTVISQKVSTVTSTNGPATS